MTEENNTPETYSTPASDEKETNTKHTVEETLVSRKTTFKTINSSGDSNSSQDASKNSSVQTDKDKQREIMFRVGAAGLALLFLAVIIYSFISKQNEKDPVTQIETPGFVNMPYEELASGADPLKVVWLGEDFMGSDIRQHSLADNIDIIKKSDSVDQISIVDYSLPEEATSTYIATYSKASPDSIKEFTNCIKKPETCDFNKVVQTSFGPGLYKQNGPKAWELRMITEDGQGVYIINDRPDVKIENVAKTLETIPAS